MRILNGSSLISHGNVEGRKAVMEILEAGLQAADAYRSVRKMVRLEGNRLIVGHPDFEPARAPRSGEEVIDLSQVGRIFVIGAAKGVQYAAKAIEDVLGERLSGGHVIAKHGDEAILDRIEVTYGAHPVPDEGCLQGCLKILELCRNLRKEDLVFTIAGNGISSLLTLPVPEVSLADVQQVTYMMQLERGVPTPELNPIRNHLDVLKGGKISRYIQPARAIHIILYDPDGFIHEDEPGYKALMYRNRFLHTLPDFTYFADAVAMLKKWDAWYDAPVSVKAYLERADSSQETVKADEFGRFNSRVFGVMPRRLGMLPSAQKRAAELGFRPHTLATFLHVEASQAGFTIMDIARTIEKESVPFEPPCALFTTGELLVTVGRENGMGGRNQEYALASALRMDGSKNIVVGAVDSDGTDGPGTQFCRDGAKLPCLAGGIVDGETVSRAKALGIDIHQALQKHDSTPALWQLDSGIVATHGVSVVDLGVTLILGRD